MVTKTPGVQDGRKLFGFVGCEATIPFPKAVAPVGEGSIRVAHNASIITARVQGSRAAKYQQVSEGGGKHNGCGGDLGLASPSGRLCSATVGKKAEDLHCGKKQR